MALTSLFIILYEEQNIIIKNFFAVSYKKDWNTRAKYLFFFLNKFKKETILTNEDIINLNLIDIILF